MAEKDKHEPTRKALKYFRDARETAKQIAEEVKKQQPELVEELRASGADEKGIVFDPDDKKTGTAYVQHNQATDEWDTEAIMDYLNKNIRGRKTLKNNVTSRVLDIKKWEAEVANRNVPAKVAKKLMKKGRRPSPFIRFGKKKEDSL